MARHGGSGVFTRSSQCSQVFSRLWDRPSIGQSDLAWLRAARHQEELVASGLKAEHRLSTGASPRRPGPLATLLAEEFDSLQLRMRLTTVLARALPSFCGMRLRTHVMRLSGVKIGRGSVIFGAPTIYGGGNIRDRLVIGEDVVMNIGCTFEVNSMITIGDRVALGHEVLVLTTSHRIGGAASRAGRIVTGPVEIGTGSWIGARAVILPGVTIGQGAVVSAGSVVNKDVPPNALVSGVPAEITVRRLPGR